MTTSSEDVLRLIEHVRVKKNDGTLYLMAERIAWMPNGKDTFTISHHYADINTQKISPDGKPKIQLQIVLQNGSDTFHFVNPLGVQNQLSDRNEVKELLQQLLPQFKRKLSKEMEEKSRVLTENPELYQLYKELVISNVITADEFWSNYAARKRADINGKNDMSQEVGVSAAFLADIKPQVDGSNGIKYNITTEVIESIFNTYPAVKRKHFENVPHKVSEQEFWQRFFQSHYFHRDRNSATKDFFSDCAKNDEQDIKRALKRGIVDPFVDIMSFEDRSVSCDTLTKSGDESSSARNDFLSANQGLIKRFNHHSIMVLDSCLNKSSHGSLNTGVVNGVINNSNKKSKSSQLTTMVTPVIDESELAEAERERDRIKKLRLIEKTEMEDLDETVGALSAKIPTLNIRNKDCYLIGPNSDCDMYSTSNGYSYSSNSVINNNSNSNSDSNTASIQSYIHQHSLVSDWRPNCKSVIQSKSAISALSELSPGGALLKSSHGSNLTDEVPVDVQKELKQLSLALNELLRHFWLCFPTTTPQLEEKLVEMRATLERFHYAKLQPFHEKLSREYHTIDLTSHLMHQIQSAYNRFTSWQAKRNALNVRK